MTSAKKQNQHDSLNSTVELGHNYALSPQKIPLLLYKKVATKKPWVICLSIASTKILKHLLPVGIEIEIMTNRKRFEPHKKPQTIHVNKASIVHLDFI